jgi:hypothetical protein
VTRADQKRARRLKREFDEVFPPPPTPEETQRRTEAFLAMWTDHVLKAARGYGDARLRGELGHREPDRMSGVEVMGACVSYGGEAPPRELRAALRKLTHGRGTDANIPAELAPKYNALSLLVLKRALAGFNAEEEMGVRV